MGRIAMLDGFLAFFTTLAFGLALSVKLQAVFLLPLLMTLAYTRQLPVRHLLWVPVPYVVLAAPALALGRSPRETLLVVYPGQYHGGFPPSTFYFSYRADELLAVEKKVDSILPELQRAGHRIAIYNLGAENFSPDENERLNKGLTVGQIASQLLNVWALVFVADFLGSDRGIKRLSLIPVSAIELDRGPVVSRAATEDEAREAMAAYGTDWFAVGEGTQLDGWADGADLGPEGVAGVPLESFRTRLSPQSTLKDALDAVVSSHTSVAAIFDDEEFLGMVTANAISAEILR